MDDKLIDSASAWSPEEDGIYVGDRPNYNSRQWNVIEQRLHLHSEKYQMLIIQFLKLYFIIIKFNSAVLPL